MHPRRATRIRTRGQPRQADRPAPHRPCSLRRKPRRRGGRCTKRQKILNLHIGPPSRRATKGINLGKARPGHRRHHRQLQPWAWVRGIGVGSDCRAAPLRTVQLICHILCAGAMRGSAAAAKLAHKVREQVHMCQTSCVLCKLLVAVAHRVLQRVVYSRPRIANSAWNRARHTTWRQSCSRDTEFQLQKKRPCIDWQPTA